MKMTDIQIEEWNEIYKPGSPCVLTLDDGTQVQTATRSIAWRLGSGSVVVMVDGKSGGWNIDRVRMLETHKGVVA